MSFVTIDTIFDVQVAEFARMKFEAEKIPVLINSMGQAPLLGTATFGGIRIEVPAEYAQRAAAILKSVKEDLDAGKDSPT